MIECYHTWGINDMEAVEFIIEQMNVKLTTGEAHSQLQAEDYNKIVQFLITHIDLPLASQVVQRIGDYVSANPHRFTIEQRNILFHSVVAARYKSGKGESVKQTPEDIRQSIMTGLNLPDKSSVHLGKSAVDDSYTIFFKDSKTRL